MAKELALAGEPHSCSYVPGRVRDVIPTTAFLRWTRYIPCKPEVQSTILVVPWGIDSRSSWSRAGFPLVHASMKPTSKLSYLIYARI